MDHNHPVDYQAALDAFRKEEHTPDNPVHSTGMPSTPPMIKGYINYQAVSKAWDKEQAGKYTIYTVEQEKEGRL